MESKKLLNDLDETKPVGYFSLVCVLLSGKKEPYRYATKWDLLLIIFGIICSFVKALAVPMLMQVYGEFTTLLVDRNLNIGSNSTATFLNIFGGGEYLGAHAPDHKVKAAIINDSMAYGILLSLCTFIQFIAGIFAVDCFNQTALRQITRIRIKYFQSLMRQEIGWYDVTGSNNNFAVRATEDIEKIRDGIAEKVSHFLISIIGFVICIVMAFYYGWKLSLVVVSYIPIVVITNIVLAKFQARLSTKELDAYAKAANVAEEVLSGIRTVFAFNGEKLEAERYNQRLLNAKLAVRLKGLLSGIGDGTVLFLFYASNALAFWYGVKLVLRDRHKAEKQYTPTVLMITFFGLINGAGNIMKSTPFLETFVTARGSAASIFRVIDRSSKIDSLSNGEKSLNLSIKGNISFKNVHFSYPSRSDIQILHGLDLEIEAGQSVAIVGHSGNGKSTCLQLLQRFYDPNHGKILIDGIDTREINVNLLRSSMAMVGQEPILFSTTIGDNIRYGKPNASDKEVVEAARNSDAHDFIVRLPQSYNTMVGEKGSQLSGGQKQRIAIARALIQNPKILLLDEATSALDYQSEEFVQETLDRVSVGRTTIIVSHRMSAIRSANRIVFIEKGIIVEDGTHTELMALKGRYYEVITAGNLNDNDDDNDDNDYVGNSLNVRHESVPKVTEKHLSGTNSDDDENYFRNLSHDVMEKLVEKRPDESKDEQIQYGNVIKRILCLCAPDWFIMFLASISAFSIGTSLPVFAILFAEVYGALAMENENEAIQKTIFLCVNFLVTGSIVFVAAVVQKFFFSTASINLTTRVRSITFKSLLRQECGWYDEDDHSSAVLSARLTSDAGSLQNAIGSPLGIIIQSISAFAIGMVISMAYSVQLTFVCLTVVPLSFASVFIEAKYTVKTAIAEKRCTENGTKIASETITNIRTVASLRQEKCMIGRYANEMMRAEKIMQKKIRWRGLVNSLAQSIPFFAYVIALCYGGYLVAQKQIEFQNVIKVTETMLYGIIMMGQTVVFAPAFTAAVVGAHRLFQIIDRVPLIKSPSDIAAKSLRKVDGKPNDIEYKDIDFRYPTRPGVDVLKNLNLKIHEGQTIALVGPSGSGKSTCIQLLQRFYEPSDGHIFLGRDEISTDISLEDLRSKLSIVSQEPVLFDKTIAENIAYGDRTRGVSMNEIVYAAKMANIHDFIEQLPMGYETNVGNKTAQLSFGQKQRIAIARALVRNPRILLLDEATSSLDLQSEQIVQQALDSAQSGRTCLIIAHRLSTVQNADVIYVLKDGNIIEHGTHIDLLAKGGIYARLYNSQKSSR